jgi:glycosyltransferase involved in cell wall biosynthesis
VGDRSGAPILLLRFLEWMRAHTTVDPDVVLLHGGSLEQSFEQFHAKVIGGNDSRLWMVQRGLNNLGYGKAAAAMAWARHAPVMWSHRHEPVIFLNSVGSLAAVRFLPANSPAKVVLYIHELDSSFDSTLGTKAWQRLSPRVDHFISCGARVTEMLVERRGVPAHQVSEHIGFIDEPKVDPERWRATRRALAIPEGALVVGASGQPDWRKAPEVFVRVARTLAARRPDLDPHFIWMGGEADSSPAWKMTHDVVAAGLRDRFHHVPETSEPGDIMGALDVFALSSREDPYPLVVLEAAALGVPVVSFDNGGVVQFAASDPDDPLAEIVPYLDGDAMADAIASLADDAGRRSSMVERARRFVLANQLTDQAAPRLFETLCAVAPSLATARVSANAASR